MKILLVHRYFWPDHPNCGQILWHLTKHLSSLGHTIDYYNKLNIIKWEKVISKLRREREQGGATEIRVKGKKL